MVVENKRVMIALVPGPGILFFSSWESIIQDRNTFIKKYKFTNKASELQLIGISRLGSNSLDAIITGSYVMCQYRPFSSLEYFRKNLCTSVADRVLIYIV